MAGHQLIRPKTGAQIVDNEIGDDRDSATEMHEGANSIGVSNIAKAVTEDATYKKVTREKGIGNADESSNCLALAAQLWIENIQAQM